VRVAAKPTQAKLNAALDILELVFILVPVTREGIPTRAPNFPEQLLK